MLDAWRMVFLASCLAGRLAAASLPNGILGTAAGAKVVDGVSASSAILGNPQGFAMDGIGNIYLADTDNNRIRRIESGSGIITTIAGTGNAGFGGDYGDPLHATLNQPEAVAMGQVPSSTIGTGQNVLYIADTGNNRIRRINLSTGIIDTIAGSGAKGFSGDGGPAVLASMNSPDGISVYGDSTVYFSDTNNHRVRAIDLGTLYISTFAGTGTGSYNGDNIAATAAQLYQPRGLSFIYPYLYIADSQNNRIRRVDTSNSNKIATVAGTGTGSYSGDAGAATSAAVNDPYDVVANTNGDLVITDYGNNAIRRVNGSTHSITTVAGTPPNGGFSGDRGPARAAALSQPYACDVAPSGSLLILDGNNCLRSVSAPSQVITTIAGNGLQENVNPNLVQLTLPLSVAVAPNHDLVICQFFANNVRKVSGSTGLISTFMGNGTFGNPVDGAQANHTPIDICTSAVVDSNNKTYLTSGVNSIWSVDDTGLVRHVGGTGSTYGGNGGPAVNAGMDPWGLALSGNYLYFVEESDGDIRRIDLNSGIVTWVAGNVGVTGWLDGVSGTAEFNQAYSIAVDAQGNLYVADGGNNCVRKVTLGNPTMVSTIAGLGPNLAGFRGDGQPAVTAALNFPYGVCVDPWGGLLVSDSGNACVRRIDLNTGLINTVVGSGMVGFSGDGGPPLLGELNVPFGLAMDGNQTLYFAEFANMVVRKVDYYQSPTPTAVSPGSSKPVAYPSPASGRLCVSYWTSQAGPVTLEVYNSALQLAARFGDSAGGPGAQLTCTDVSQLAQGAYFMRILQAGSAVQTTKFKVIH